MQTTLTLRPAEWSRYPRLAQFESLEARQRNLYMARASVRVPLCRRYTVVDVAQQGAAYYAPTAPSAAPLYSPLQAALLDAIRRMRRWHYYSDSALPTASANEALDGCDCRVCLDPQAADDERSYWRYMARQRWHRPA
jgi:hypothetical protein